MAMSRKQRNRALDQLRRRRDFLAARIKDYHGASPSYDKAELSALNYALRVVENAISADVIDNLE